MLTPRELCNVIYVRITAGLDEEDRNAFEAFLSNPQGAVTVADLRQMGAA